MYVDIGITLHVLVCAGHQHVNVTGSVLRAYVTINLYKPYGLCYDSQVSACL